MGLLPVLIRQDLTGYLRGPLPVHLILLLPPAAFLAAWFGYAASPVIPIVIILFAGLEPRFNNIFFTTPAEFRALAVLPVSWSAVVLSRNLATLILTFAFLAPLSLLVLFITPWPFTWNDAIGGTLYLWSVLPPLLHFGNAQSVRSPRPACGLRMNDVAEMLWMMGSVALASVPYLLLCEAFDMKILCAAYAAGWSVYWWKVSPARTGERITSELDTISYLI